MHKLLVLLCIVGLMLTGCKEDLQMDSVAPKFSEAPKASELGITEADVLVIRQKAEQLEKDVFVSSDTWACSDNDEGKVAISSEQSGTGFTFYYMCDNFDTKDEIINYLTTELTLKNSQEVIATRMDSGLLAEINGKISIVPWEGTDTLDWDHAKIIDFQVGDQRVDATIQVFDYGSNTYDTYEGVYTYENGWKEDSLRVKAMVTDESEEVSVDTLKGTVTIPNRLMMFLNDLNHSENNMKLIQILSEDLDKDGYTEHVVSYGSDAERYEITYVIRDKESTYQLLNPEINSGGYSIYNISLISMEGSEQRYIYTGITNGASLVGTAIYSVSGQEVTELYHGASATGEGEDQLEDEDKDGVFDKVVAYRYFQYHTWIYTSYWNGKAFDESVDSFNNDVSGFVYPESSKALIETYVEAVFLGAEEEIKKLVTPEMVNAFDVRVVFPNSL